MEISSDQKKSPYAPGNESMTNPSVLSLVAKDGMLQRLQDSEDNYVENWSIRVFESKNPAVSTQTENIPIVINHIIASLHTDIITSLLPHQSQKTPLQQLM